MVYLHCSGRNGTAPCLTDSFLQHSEGHVKVVDCSKQLGSVAEIRKPFKQSLPRSLRLSRRRQPSKLASSRRVQLLLYYFDTATTVQSLIKRPDQV